MTVTGPTHHVEKDTEMSGSGVGINHADMGQLHGLIDLAGRASCLAHFVYSFCKTSLLQRGTGGHSRR